MKTYKLLCDWQISIPDYWQGEYDKEMVNADFTGCSNINFKN